MTMYNNLMKQCVIYQNCITNIKVYVRILILI